MYEILILFIFILGLHFCLKNKSNDVIEGYHQRDCPNLLIKQDGKLILKNTRKQEVPGVNPITFKNLEEYNQFIRWQRANGILCPVLYLEQTYDTQGRFGAILRFLNVSHAVWAVGNLANTRF